MRPAIIRPVRARPLDVHVVELSHGSRCHERIEDRILRFAVMIVGAAQVYDDICFRLIVTDAVNEAAARRVAAVKSSEIDGAAILQVYGFRPNFGGEQNND